MRAAAALVAALVVAVTNLESRFALVSAADKEGGPILGLVADDFIVEDGGTRAEVMSVTPASYPVAIVVDTSSFARSDFQQIRDAVHQFVGSLSGRDVALYATGMVPKRRAEFTRDLRQLETSIAATSAQPDGPPLTLDTIVDAATDLRERRDLVTRIVVVSAGGRRARFFTPSWPVDRSSTSSIFSRVERTPTPEFRAATERRCRRSTGRRTQRNCSTT